MATVEGATAAATDATETSSPKVGGAAVGGGAVRVGAGGTVGGVGSSNTPTKPRMVKVMPVPRRTPPMIPRPNPHGSILRLGSAGTGSGLLGPSGSQENGVVIGCRLYG